MRHIDRKYRSATAPIVNEVRFLSKCIKIESLILQGNFQCFRCHWVRFLYISYTIKMQLTNRFLLITLRRWKLSSVYHFKEHRQSVRNNIILCYYAVKVVISQILSISSESVNTGYMPTCECS